MRSILYEVTDITVSHPNGSDWEYSNSFPYPFCLLIELTRVRTEYILCGVLGDGMQRSREKNLNQFNL